MTATAASSKTDAPRKVTVATVWLDGCSGCHMSFLDIDERLVDLAQHIELVYSPIVDLKKPPPNTDVGLIEGAVSNEEDAHKARMMRDACGFLISLGDCAVTGNVPSMRNVFELGTVMDRAFKETVDTQPVTPTKGVPPLLPKVKPVHDVVPVDLHLPGCPPPADAIYEVLSELIAGRTPDPLRLSRFGR